MDQRSSGHASLNAMVGPHVIPPRPVMRVVPARQGRNQSCGPFSEPSDQTIECGAQQERPVTHRLDWQDTGWVGAPVHARASVLGLLRLDFRVCEHAAAWTP